MAVPAAAGLGECRTTIVFAFVVEVFGGSALAILKLIPGNQQYQLPIFNAHEGIMGRTRSEGQ